MYECEFVQRLKPNTLQDYRQAFSVLMRLQPSTSIESMTPSTIALFFNQLQERNRKIGKGQIVTGIKKSTILTYWNKLNGFFAWMVLRGYLQCNPLLGLKRPHVIHDAQKFLDKDQIEKIIAAILTTAYNPFLLKRNIVIFYLFLFCGLRRNELLLLQLRDIDLDKRMLTVRAITSKVERTRHIPLNSQLVLHLKDYISARKGYKTQYLITSSTRDTGLTPDGLKHLVAALKEASGIHFHVHQLRHTFAVNFLNYSGNIAKLQQLLGHTNPAMTLHYTMCLPPQTMRSDVENMSIEALI